MSFHSPEDKSLSTFADVPVLDQRSGKNKVYLHLSGIERKPTSFNVHVYLNAEGVDHKTDRHTHQGFAGTLFMYGQGPSPEAKLNISRAYERLASKDHPVQITLVVVDLDGKPIDASSFAPNSLSIRKT